MTTNNVVGLVIGAFFLLLGVAALLQKKGNLATRVPLGLIAMAVGLLVILQIIF
ncbi:MAG: hypothetical protein ACYS0G_12990 [Planctomycetota bacterium]|jgi:hypothetical protein